MYKINYGNVNIGNTAVSKRLSVQMDYVEIIPNTSSDLNKKSRFNIPTPWYLHNVFSGLVC